MSIIDAEAAGQNQLEESLKLLGAFRGSSLGRTIAKLENDLYGLRIAEANDLIAGAGVNRSLVESAFAVKAASAQIDNIVHAVGILYTLPILLEPDEVVLNLSLGAGNTGRQHDLETDRRVAEFAFSNWRGGSEAIRQNKVFKDYFELLTAETAKRKVLYVVGAAVPLIFFHGGRALTSVLSKNVAVAARFKAKYGDQYKTVGAFYRDHSTEVEIQDLCELVPDFIDFASRLPPEV